VSSCLFRERNLSRNDRGTTYVLRFGSDPGAERNLMVPRLCTELFETYLKGISNDAQSSTPAGISAGAAHSIAASEACSGRYPSFSKIIGAGRREMVPVC
jgi:hypothetical protein